MRSRYSAYALGLGEYLYETTDPKFASREEIVEYISQSKEQLEWLQLDVISSSKNRVEFKAYYMEDEKLFVLHEKSEFINIDGKWFYESGELLTSKIERNIPCPCGSGKKVKKCHK
ncbi:MAG: zinc chelation protein SecC [Helicobacteraceae bacterium]|nr:zinc chelation protein SecC [Helicobacteraceae bacterium]